MVVKLQAVIFGTTSKIAWDNWVFPLHVLIQIYGLGCQNDQQGRNTTNMF